MANHPLVQLRPVVAHQGADDYATPKVEDPEAGPVHRVQLHFLRLAYPGQSLALKIATGSRLSAASHLGWPMYP